MRMNGPALLDLDYHEASEFPDLYGGESHSVRVVHRLEHIRGECLYPVVYCLYLPARFAEDRVAFLDYIEFCH